MSSFAFTSPMVQLGTISKRSSASASTSRSRMPQRHASITVALTSAERHAGVFRESLEALRNEKKAVQMSSYMRHNFDFLGVSAPKRRDATREEFETIRIASGLVPSLAIDICDLLWKLPEREYHYTGIDLLDYCKSSWVQCPADNIVSSLETYIGTKSWWDTIDPIAANLVRTAHESHPKEIRGLVSGNWEVRDSIWFRRSAILWQLKQKKNTDEKLLFDTIRANAQHEDAIVIKAIGWILREYRKSRPKSVDRFVQDNLDSLDPRAVKEAWKYKEEKILK